MRTLLVINPSSGRGGALKAADSAREALPQDDLTHFVIHQDDPASLPDLLACSDRAVVAGGDGTFHFIAPLARESATPLALIPCGTGNALAAALGANACRTLQLLNSGACPRPMDLIKTDQEFAVFCAGAGLDALVIAALSRRAVRRWGRLAYVPAVGRAHRAAQIMDVSITVDGERVFRGDCWLCMVTNVANLGSSIVVAPGARPDDGLLHVSLFEPPVPSVPRMLWMLGLSAYVRRGVRVDRRWRGQDVLIESPGMLPIEVDGEVAASANSLHAHIAPGALKVYY